MMKLIRISFPPLFIIVMIAFGCIEPYNPPVVRQDTNYLVADAYLNSGDGVVTVTLSRTQPLYSSEPPPLEVNAVVTLEDDQGTIYPMQEQGKGVYSGNNITVNPARQYRMHIRTSAQEDFFSAYISVKPSPVIDSVFWMPERDGIFIYVNTHDLSGTSRYYKWTYTETWEYTAAFDSNIKILEAGVIVPRPFEETIYTCWRTVPSTGIFVGTSSRLTSDVISDYPLIFLPKGTIKLTRRYSVNVQQQAITEEAYNYWLQLEQTTEKLGGLFDPLPSQITGNFYNATDPSQPVLGFFSGGSVQEKRIFVSFGDLPSHLRAFPRESCQMDTIEVADIGNFGSATLLISSYGDPVVEGYLTSSVTCIDCRSKGGTTVKPSFWK